MPQGAWDAAAQARAVARHCGQGRHAWIGTHRGEWCSICERYRHDLHAVTFPTPVRKAPAA
jgi:hypothetical protein